MVCLTLSACLLLFHKKKIKKNSGFGFKLFCVFILWHIFMGLPISLIILFISFRITTLSLISFFFLVTISYTTSCFVSLYSFIQNFFVIHMHGICCEEFFSSFLKLSLIVMQFYVSFSFLCLLYTRRRVLPFLIAIFTIASKVD